jgi:hypothetical protein
MDFSSSITHLLVINRFSKTFKKIQKFQKKKKNQKKIKKKKNQSHYGSSNDTPA